MKKYEELHSLIHSMDMQEKRYFKLFAKRHIIGEENKYVQLFDVIDKMEECDDADVKKNFKGDYIAKHFPAAKQYLMRLVQKALYHYHDNESPVSVIFRHLRLAEIFFSRTQFNLCKGSLKKAEKLAEENEFFLYSLLIKEFQSKLANQQLDLKVLNDQVKNGERKEKEFVEKFVNYRQYARDILHLKLDSYTKGNPEGKKQFRVIDKIIKEKRYKDPSNALSLMARLQHLMVVNNYNFIRKDPVTHNRSTKKLLDLFHANSELIKRNNAQYLAVFHNYLLSCINTQKTKEYHSLLKKFLSYTARPGQSRYYIFEKYLLLEMERMVRAEASEEIVSFIPEASRLLNKYGNKFSIYAKANAGNIITISLLNSGNLDEALKWNNKMIYEEEFMKDEEVFRDALLLHFLINILNGNFQLLRTNFNFCKKFLKDISEKSAIERIYLRFLPEILKEQSSKKRKQGVAHLAAGIAALKRNESKQNAFFYVDHAALLSRLP